MQPGFVYDSVYVNMCYIISTVSYVDVYCTVCIYVQYICLCVCVLYLCFYLVHIRPHIAHISSKCQKEAESARMLLHYSSPYVGICGIVFAIVDVNGVHKIITFMKRRFIVATVCVLNKLPTECTICTNKAYTYLLTQ